MVLYRENSYFRHHLKNSGSILIKFGMQDSYDKGNDSFTNFGAGPPRISISRCVCGGGGIKFHGPLVCTLKDLFIFKGFNRQNLPIGETNGSV